MKLAAFFLMLLLTGASASVAAQAARWSIGSINASSPSGVCGAWGSTLPSPPNAGAMCAADYEASLNRCRVSFTNNAGGTCAYFGNQATPTQSYDCPNGENFIMGSCRPATQPAANNGCNSTEGQSIEGFTAGNEAQLNALASADPNAFRFVRRGGCTYRTTHSGACTQGGILGICYSAVGNGIAEGLGTPGSASTTSPVAALQNFPTSVNQTPQSNPASPNTGGTGGGTGGTNTGFNTADAANTRRIASNTNQGVQAIDRLNDTAGAVSRNQIAALERLGNQINAAGGGAIGGGGAPPANANPAPQCGRSPLPPCDSRVVDSANAAGQVSGVQSAGAALEAEAGNNPANAELGKAKNEFGGSQSRWNINFGLFGVTGSSDCDFKSDFQIQGKPVNIGVNTCPYIPFARGVMYWVMMIITAFAMWSMMYSPKP